jgi:hypothetical protein
MRVAVGPAGGDDWRRRSVIAVDLHTGMLPSDFSDAVHLNQQGSMKVADRWYAKLAPFFGKP